MNFVLSQNELRSFRLWENQNAIINNNQASSFSYFEDYEGNGST